jgi:hypothetical protein
MPTPAQVLLRRYRLALLVFIIGLVLSGLTAFPLLRELDALVALRGLDALPPETALAGLDTWLLTVRNGLRASYAQYPWLAYGTDWLAFGHLVIALFFIGPWRDPVGNRWVLQVGMLACVLVMPLALIAGAVRQIPLGWRLIDCSFGIIGILPLAYCYHLTAKLAKSLHS